MTVCTPCWPWSVVVREGVRVRVWYREGVREGYTGWVIRGCTTQPARFARGGHDPAKRAPEALQGLEWVGSWPDVQGTVRTTPPGPGRSLAGPSLSFPCKCRLWANRARIEVKTGKVSQNGKVSPKSVQKAQLSPYFQKRLQKSPLEILRFPFSAAFSHKELMGLF